MIGRSDRHDREDDMRDREPLSDTDIRDTGAYGDMDAPLVSPQRDASDLQRMQRGDETMTGADAPLFSSNEAEQLRSRWESVQAGFVDEPRRAVEEADGLVRTVMERLTDGFADQRQRLEKEWGASDEVSTEDLRMALRHYRSFFDRLLKL